MIKNSRILQNFEKQEREKETSAAWYKKADQMYEIGLKLNANAIKKGGKEHLKMLVDMQKKK